ncbi:MAG: twin-arginine translocase subunit TatC, partial [Tissierellia bacterium]|nr:twin-arginine translocase subunit TatC [Tissierellia bacterium]
NFQMNEIKPMISFNNYLSFAITFVLSFGVAFEMPILMALVVKFGLVNTKTLKKHRRMAILLIFVLAAILTPPDVISQISLAIPMILLFEIGLFLSKLVETNKVEANK